VPLTVLVLVERAVAVSLTDRRPVGVPLDDVDAVVLAVPVLEARILRVAVGERVDVLDSRALAVKVGLELDVLLVELEAVFVFVIGPVRLTIEEALVVFETSEEAVASGELELVLEGGIDLVTGFDGRPV
jgi:hypothetical protein